MVAVVDGLFLFASLLTTTCTALALLWQSELQKLPLHRVPCGIGNFSPAGPPPEKQKQRPRTAGQPRRQAWQAWQARLGRSAGRRWPTSSPAPVPASRLCLPPSPSTPTCRTVARSISGSACAPQLQPPTGRPLVKAWLPMRPGEVLKRRGRNPTSRQLETDLTTRLHRRPRLAMAARLGAGRDSERARKATTACVTLGLRRAWSNGVLLVEYGRLSPTEELAPQCLLDPSGRARIGQSHAWMRHVWFAHNLHRAADHTRATETWRRRLTSGNRNMTRSHPENVGNRPMCWPSQASGSQGSPRASSGCPSTPCSPGVELSQPVGVPIRARICAVLLRRPLLGHTPADSPGAVSWGAGAARRRHWTPFSCVRCFLSLAAPASRTCQICHTPELVFWPSGRGG